MTKTTQQPSTKPKAIALVGFFLSLANALYLLPIWVIALYLIVTPASQNGVGWIMVAMIFAGMVIVPVLMLASIVLSIISIATKAPNKALAIWTLGILGASVVITYLLLSST